jgi:hypothetical protein
MVPSFASSDGWIDTGPRKIHRRVPLRSGWKSVTTSSSTTMARPP